MKRKIGHKVLSPEQGFRAMFVFLDEYYRRTNGSAALGDVLGDIYLLRGDGMPADPAAWGDWLAAVEVILSDRKEAAAQAIAGGQSDEQH